MKQDTSALGLRTPYQNLLREDLIVLAYKSVNEPLTDREVMEELGFDDMNTVRPTITRLVQEGVLKIAQHTVCPVTGKTVRCCRLA